MLKFEHLQEAGILQVRLGVDSESENTVTASARPVQLLVAPLVYRDCQCCHWQYL